MVQNLIPPIIDQSQSYPQSLNFLKDILINISCVFLIHENQSGFRSKRSCQTALIRLVDQWMTCIDKGDIVGTLFIDFRKAFDLVDHSILLKKNFLIINSNILLLIYLLHTFKTACKSWNAEMV